ncbi:hypothetical protein Tco_1187924 [Tanacetum coccineum]
MSYSLPHTIKKIKEYVKKQCEIDDETRQEDFIVITKLFNEANLAKQALMEQYAECKDVPQKRRDVIDKFLRDKAMKDYKIVLSKSVNQSTFLLQNAIAFLIVTTSRYVVPTGRVIVPAGRYVVPTGKDTVIVSTGRTKVIPAGRTKLVLVVLFLLVVGMYMRYPRK